MDLIILDGHLIDEQPNIGLAQGGVIASQTFTEQFAKSANYIRSNPALTRSELPPQTP